MKTMVGRISAAALLCATAGLASAAPRIVSLGSGSPSAASNDGTWVVGSGGCGVLTRWHLTPSGVTLESLTGGSTTVGMTTDGQIVTGAIVNTLGTGGLPNTATIAARWDLANGWRDLGVFGNIDSGASSGSISTPYDISPTGAFIVGQGYIAPNNSFRFRPWIWDASLLSGAGQSNVLPTTFDAGLNRNLDGRATGVSADGLVICGGETPNTSSRKACVWRYDSGSQQYVRTFLPNGINPSTNVQYLGHEALAINAAGTIIMGMSQDFDATLGFEKSWLTKWNWNADTQSWDRQPLTSELESLPAWWVPPPECNIPPSFIPSGMSDDGSTIVGIMSYSTCGSFQRAGFIWRQSVGQAEDLYEYLVTQGTPGMSDFAPVNNSGPPRLGWANGISPNGDHLFGYGGPFTPGGPAWIASLPGGDCVAPFLTCSPSNVTFSRCSTFGIIMNAGAGGSPALTYQWHKDGQPLVDGNYSGASIITGATTSQLRVTRVVPGDAGIYTCVITGQCGNSVTTAPATATLDPNVPTLQNDTCATALDVNEGTFSFNPCGAYVDDPTPFNCAPTGVSVASDAWYRYTPTFDGLALIHTCGATYDTILAVYDACNGTEIACRDDVGTGLTGCSSTRSRTYVPVTAGVPLWVRVAALGSQFSGTPTGQVTIMRESSDFCGSATVASVGANPFYTGDASNDTIVSCNATASPDVWFKFTAPGVGKVNAATCPGTSLNTVLTAYAECGGAELACNDNAGTTGCTNQSVINNLPVAAGQTIYYRIASNTATAKGPGVLTLAFDCSADFNNDGQADFFDYLDFVQAFSAEDIAADFNGDQQVDFFDYLDFAAAFDLGC